MIKIGLIILIGISTLIYFYVFKFRKSNPIQTKIDTDLLSNYITRTIDLSKCEFKSNDFYREIEIESGRSAAMNNLMGYEDKNVSVQRINQTIIVYKEIDDVTNIQRTYYSGIINKDKITVEMFCGIKKNTKLYINPNNPDEYHLDTKSIFE